VERRNMIGGVCINTGTVPSKTLKEAVVYLTGLNQREMYGQSYRLKDDITVADLAARTANVIGREVNVIRNQLSPADRRILGVHVFGSGATEFVHIGQAVMGCAGTLDYLVDAVFNYPSLAECYKVAALDAMNKMRDVARMA
jgi:pyruvate/2-oxoglutarate dehydrogenase complex dihydrolipoamide dehydrogenase (E3) component